MRLWPSGRPTSPDRHIGESVRRFGWVTVLGTAAAIATFGVSGLAGSISAAIVTGLGGVTRALAAARGGAAFWRASGVAAGTGVEADLVMAAGIGCIGLTFAVAGLAAG